MRVMMTEDSNNSVSGSFLLDDDSRYCSRYFYKCYLTVWYCLVCHLKLIPKDIYSFNFSFSLPFWWCSIIMQHPFLCGRHFQVNATSRYSRYRTSAVNPWKLRVRILTSTLGMMITMVDTLKSFPQPQLVHKQFNIVHSSICIIPSFFFRSNMPFVWCLVKFIFSPSTLIQNMRGIH